MKLIYADTNKYDEKYRLILTTLGTKRDLEKHGIALKSGLKLTFYMDDADTGGNLDNLILDGIVEFDDVNQRWVAAIDWDEGFKHVSDFSAAELERLGEN